MVKIIQQNNSEIYQCEQCLLKYAKKEIAEKCETWCRKHESCNLEIIEHAIEEAGG